MASVLGRGVLGTSLISLKVTSFFLLQAVICNGFFSIGLPVVIVSVSAF